MAIALDATASAVAGGASTVSYSHTFTGADRIVWIEALTANIAASSPSITGVTVNGVAATELGHIHNPGPSISAYNSLWYMVAPPTGAQTIVVTASGSADACVGRSASYTGAKQTGVPDNSTTPDIQSTASYSKTLTPSADNCWIVGSIEFHIGTSTAASGCVYRVGVGGGDGLFDTNGAVHPASATTFVVDGDTGVALFSGILASFAPVSGSSPLRLNSRLAGLGASGPFFQNPLN